MAHTRNMILLMQHAADLLDACQPMHNAREVSRLSPSSADRDMAMDFAAQEVAAIATASAVLSMVANAMDDDPATEFALREPGSPAPLYQEGQE